MENVEVEGKVDVAEEDVDVNVELVVVVPGRLDVVVGGATVVDVDVDLVEVTVAVPWLVVADSVGSTDAKNVESAADVKGVADAYAGLSTESFNANPSNTTGQASTSAIGSNPAGTLEHNLSLT